VVGFWGARDVGPFGDDKLADELQTARLGGGEEFRSIEAPAEVLGVVSVLVGALEHHIGRGRQNRGLPRDEQVMPRSRRKARHDVGPVLGIVKRPAGEDEVELPARELIVRREKGRAGQLPLTRFTLDGHFLAKVIDLDAGECRLGDEGVLTNAAAPVEERNLAPALVGNSECGKGGDIRERNGRVVVGDVGGRKSGVVRFDP
jgi:hypothetical protein